MSQIAMKTMLEEIRSEVRYTRTMIRRDTLSANVMEAMERVPRHEFVIPETLEHAYHNGPLPIGHGQTISQPYIVALMTDLAEIEETDKVLEIGTGSGYQSAILATIANQVYSVEIIPSLAESATERLRQLGYSNVETRCADGHLGWEEQAPFDAILVTAAATQIPDALVTQLKNSGRLIIPIGPPAGHQELIVVEKDAMGKTSQWSALPVAFVPLTGHG